MYKKILLWLIILTVFSASYWLKKKNSHSPAKSAKILLSQRIISLAPSITETLFALDLGDRVVGVTPDCLFPPEAHSIPKVGSYLDPNYEAIFALQPDLIVLLPDHQIQKQKLHRLGLQTLTIDQRNIQGILESFLVLGEIGQKKDQAEKIIHAIQNRINIIKNNNKGKKSPKVLISVGRTNDFDSLTDIYISGNKGFFREMITLAGATNAYQGKIQFPTVSRESIIRMNPDIIIEMIPNLDQRNIDKEMILKGWGTLSQVKAVRNNNIHILGQDFVMIPGPRFILTLEEIAHIIHPNKKKEYK